jgi:hypothetical protein
MNTGKNLTKVICVCILLFLDCALEEWNNPLEEKTSDDKNPAVTNGIEEAPVVIAVFPKDGETDVIRDLSEIVIQFSNAMNNVTLDDALTSTDNSLIFGVPTWDDIKKTSKYPITSTPLKPLESYNLIVLKSAENINGTAIAYDFTWSFTTIGNVQPLADAGSDQNVWHDDLITLDGSFSSDADQDNLTYEWSQIFGDDITLSDNSSEMPTFISPTVPGTLTFQLIVSDGYLESEPDTIDVIVENGSPVADAGEDQDVGKNALVTLVGFKSSDPENDTLTYNWTQTSGLPVTLSSNTSPMPTFTCPDYATLEFQLIVNDGYTVSAPDTVTIYVNPHWSYVGAVGFSAGQIKSMSMYIYSGTPYVAYQEGFGWEKITVMKYNGTYWENVGNPEFSDNTAWVPDIFLAGDGTPYVVYSDWGNDFRATVQKFNGSNWESVGPLGFSEQTYYTSIFVDGGTPYIAYHAIGVTVMKYNVSVWESVGTTNFANGNADPVSLFIYGGTPYVGFVDGALGEKVTVMEYTGGGATGWENVGTPGFSPGTVSDVTLFISDGTPYVAFVDPDDAHKLSVMKYNGSNWEYVGLEGFYDGWAGDASLFIYNGVPFVAFRDEIEYTVQVMKYNGSNWEEVGDAGLSPYAEYINLFIYNGILYVAYHSNGAVLIKYE